MALSVEAPGTIVFSLFYFVFSIGTRPIFKLKCAKNLCSVDIISFVYLLSRLVRQGRVDTCRGVVYGSLLQLPLAPKIDVPTLIQITFSAPPPIVLYGAL